MATATHYGNPSSTTNGHEPQTVAELADVKCLPIDHLTGPAIGLADLPGGGISIPYLDAAGNELFDRSRGVPGGPRFLQPAGVKLVPYGLWRPAPRGAATILVEGESDCWAIWLHGWAAIGIPGANTYGCIQAEHVQDVRTLFVHREPDAGGEQFVRGVAARLAAIGWTGRAFVFYLPGYKDPSDLHASCDGDVERFAAVLGDALEIAQPLTMATASEKPKTTVLTPDAYLTGAEFKAKHFPREWLVNKLIVANENLTLGGPKKSLKTTLAVDLALSLGSGTKFLGYYDVPKRVRTLVVSCESGGATIQETALRICAAKDIDLADTETRWWFERYQLASVEHLDRLRISIEHHQAKVTIFDPVYLMLLGAAEAKGKQASNLFDMGPILIEAAKACLDAGATPILTCHARKNLSEPYEPMELEDIAYSGIQEFSRQWLLINRREKYDSDRAGEHKLWLSSGGSGGQCGLWAVNVAEGELQEDFSGRYWAVSVKGCTDARQEQQEHKAQRTESAAREKVKLDGNKVLETLDKHDRDRIGLSKMRVRELSGLGGTRMTGAVANLLDGLIIEEVMVGYKTGAGHKVEGQTKGIRRVTGLSGF